MHPVQRRDGVLLQEACGRHVGAEHAFFDQAVRIVALGRADFRDLPVGAEDDAGFLGLEIDRAADMAAGQQRFIQRIQLLQVRHHAGQLLAQVLGLDAVGVLEQLADLGVGQAGMGVDHRFVELVAGQLASLGQGHLADHGQPVDQRIQRAETIGQHLRQHRDHPLGKYTELPRLAASSSSAEPTFT